MCVYILKDLYVHVNVVIAINMYGNICGGFVNKTWEQVTPALTHHGHQHIIKGLLSPSFVLSLKFATYDKVKSKLFLPAWTLRSCYVCLYRRV